MQLNIYSDGGSRGNPGPAAAAFVILNDEGKKLRSEAFFLGRRTNNQAEYEALIAALKAATLLNAQKILCNVDSELVCNHLLGVYKVKNSDLRRLYNEVELLKRCFDKVDFVRVSRSNRFICEADRLVNEKLDEIASQRS